jgi:hypothetical protein
MEPDAVDVVRAVDGGAVDVRLEDSHDFWPESDVGLEAAADEVGLEDSQELTNADSFDPLLLNTEDSIDLLLLNTEDFVDPLLLNSEDSIMLAVDSQEPDEVVPE